MEDKWICVHSQGESFNYWEEIYINPEEEIAKVNRSEFTYFNYHDEERWDDEEWTISIEEALTRIPSIEQAIARVYPNEQAVVAILKNTSNDYTEVLEMLERDKEMFVQYLSPNIFPIVFGTIVLGLGLIGGLATHTLSVIIITVIWSLVIMAKTISAKSELQNLLDDMDNQQKLSNAILEFKNADSYINDCVKLGKTYLFGKNTGIFVKCSEITRIYQWTHKTNFVVDKKELRIVLKGGRVRCLCKLPLKEKVDGVVTKLCTEVKRKNPLVKVG